MYLSRHNKCYIYRAGNLLQLHPTLGGSVELTVMYTAIVRLACAYLPVGRGSLEGEGRGGGVAI